MNSRPGDNLSRGHGSQEEKHLRVQDGIGRWGQLGKQGWVGGDVPRMRISPVGLGPAKDL